MSTPTQERHRRQLSRRIAAALIRGMADTDTSVAEIASRLGMQQNALCNGLESLIDGGQTRLDFIADFASAMGCDLHLVIEPRAEPLAEETA